jgi:MFS family permease
VIAVSFTLLIKDKQNSVKVKSKKNYLEFWKSAPKEYKRVLVLITIFSLVNSSDVFLILKSQNISNSNSLAIFGYVFYNIIYAVSSYPLGGLSDKLGKQKVFSFGLIIFSAVYFGFAFVDNIDFIWAFFALYGIYAASTEGVSKAWISDLIPNEQRGSAIGLLTMLSSFSVLIGSFLTGVLWDKFGSSVPFIISASLSLVVSIIIITLYPKKTHQ